MQSKNEFDLKFLDIAKEIRIDAAQPWTMVTSKSQKETRVITVHSHSGESIAVCVFMRSVMDVTRLAH